MLYNIFGIPTCPGPELKYSECDCLNMAIYVPNTPAPSGRFPVIVCLHGGRLRQCGNVHPAHASSALVDSRSFPHGQDEVYGNWGLHDQKLGLEWIRDHIHVFGGKHTDITTMGHSAGAVSLLLHITIPSHHGLSARVISHSPAPLSRPNGTRSNSQI